MPARSANHPKLTPGASAPGPYDEGPLPGAVPRAAFDPLLTFSAACDAGPMPSAAEILLGALKGRSCRVVRREADWTLDFGDGHTISVAAPWRLVTAEGIAFGDEDHGHQFGLPAPVDGPTRTG